MNGAIKPFRLIHVQRADSVEKNFTMKKLISFALFATIVILVLMAKNAALAQTAGPKASQSVAVSLLVPEDTAGYEPCLTIDGFMSGKVCDLSAEGD